MKRLLLAIILILSIWTPAFGVGTCTSTGPTAYFDPSVSMARQDAIVYVVTLTCTADAGNASYPATEISGTASTSKLLWGWFLYSVETVSGATQPTDGYSITVKNAAGWDFLGGKGATTQSNSQTVPVKTWAFPAGGSFSPVIGPLTFAATGNLVNSANITVTFTFVK